MKKYKITVVGIGYVGLSVATLLAQHNAVCMIDIDLEKVEMVNKRKSPIRDNEIENYFQTQKLDIMATMQPEIAYSNADFIIIAVDTNYNEQKLSLDTSTVETVIRLARKYNSNATIVIKSTVPIGYTSNIRKETGIDNILFCPEFLQETRALYDNLFPSRIIIGTEMQNENMVKRAYTFAFLLKQGAIKKNVDILIMESTEAEAVKLFSNAYLALRISYFNELDMYAELMGIDVKRVITGICLDPRIGFHYNNPSFGYGGYCLPKDTRQLLANYKGMPECLISAIVKSNQMRKDFISNQIIKKLEIDYASDMRMENIVIGIFRLISKKNSDNFKTSSLLDIMEQLTKRGISIVVYEPLLKNNQFADYPVINDLEKFKKTCTLIIANRYENCLDTVKDKVYTRDVFCNN